MTDERLTGKEIYERKKRAKAERLMRHHERMLDNETKEDFGELLFASMADSFERIAGALERLADAREAPSQPQVASPGTGTPDDALPPS